jgi:hypothetical protein
LEDLLILAKNSTNPKRRFQNTPYDTMTIKCEDSNRTSVDKLIMKANAQNEHISQTAKHNSLMKSKNHTLDRSNSSVSFKQLNKIEMNFRK